MIGAETGVAGEDLEDENSSNIVVESLNHKFMMMKYLCDTTRV